MNDPIADMLTRIRNSAMVNKNQVTLPHSLFKERVAKLLSANGFLYEVKTEETAGRKQLGITINDENQPSAITSIKRLSTPGRRTYVQAKDIPSVKRGRGIVVISTSKGLMTGEDAKKQKLGGELICEVY